MQIIHFFYNIGLKGWENYLVFLLCVIIPLVLIYAITSKIVKTKYESKYEALKNGNRLGLSCSSNRFIQS